MGCGKSHWGKIWAKESNLGFIELDHLIEQQEGQTIAALFETKGETYFRKAESNILQSHSQGEWIFSTGGGAPCFFDNMEWMNAHGHTIYLEASPPFLAKRLMPEKDHRPILKNIADDQLENFIIRKLSERKSFYQQAKTILNAEVLTNETLSDLIKIYSL